MKRKPVHLDVATHRKLKLYAIHHDMTITEAVKVLLEKSIKENTKNE